VRVCETAVCTRRGVLRAVLKALSPFVFMAEEARVIVGAASSVEAAQRALLKESASCERRC